MPLITSGTGFYKSGPKTNTIVVSDRETGEEKVVGDLYIKTMTYLGDGIFVGVRNEMPPKGVVKPDDRKMIYYNINTGEETPIITASERGYTELEFPYLSADKKFLYFVTDCEDIVKYNLETSQVKELLRESAQIQGLDISKDGMTLYYACGRNLKMVNLETKECKKLLDGAEHKASGYPGEWPVRVSPDGRYVLFADREDRESLYDTVYRFYAYDIQEDKAVEVLKTYYHVASIDWLED